MGWAALSFVDRSFVRLFRHGDILSSSSSFPFVSSSFSFFSSSFSYFGGSHHPCLPRHPYQPRYPCHPHHPGTPAIMPKGQEGGRDKCWKKNWQKIFSSINILKWRKNWSNHFSGTMTPSPPFGRWWGGRGVWPQKNVAKKYLFWNGEEMDQITFLGTFGRGGAKKFFIPEMIRNGKKTGQNTLYNLADLSGTICYCFSFYSIWDEHSSTLVKLISKSGQAL